MSSDNQTGSEVSRDPASADVYDVISDVKDDGKCDSENPLGDDGRGSQNEAQTKHADEHLGENLQDGLQNSLNDDGLQNSLNDASKDELQDDTASPIQLVGSPNQLSDSPNQLTSSPNQLPDSPNQLPGSPYLGLIRRPVKDVPRVSGVKDVTRVSGVKDVTRVYGVDPDSLDLVDGISPCSSRSRPTQAVLPAIHETGEELGEELQNCSTASSSSSASSMTSSPGSGRKMTSVRRVSSRPALTSISEEAARLEEANTADMTRVATSDKETADNSSLKSSQLSTGGSETESRATNSVTDLLQAPIPGQDMILRDYVAEKIEEVESRLGRRGLVEISDVMHAVNQAYAGEWVGGNDSDPAHRAENDDVTTRDTVTCQEGEEPLSDVIDKTSTDYKPLAAVAGLNIYINNVVLSCICEVILQLALQRSHIIAQTQPNDDQSLTPDNDTTPTCRLRGSGSASSLTSAALTDHPARDSQSDSSHHSDPAHPSVSGERLHEKEHEFSSGKCDKGGKRSRGRERELMKRKRDRAYDRHGVEHGTGDAHHSAGAVEISLTKGHQGQGSCHLEYLVGGSSDIGDADSIGIHFYQEIDNVDGIEGVYDVYNDTSRENKFKLGDSLKNYPVCLSATGELNESQNHPGYVPNSPLEHFLETDEEVGAVGDQLPENNDMSLDIPSLEVGRDISSCDIDDTSLVVGMSYQSLQFGVSDSTQKVSVDDHSLEADFVCDNRSLGDCSQSSELNIKPLEVGSQELEVTAQSLELSKQPPEVNSKTLEINNQPIVNENQPQDVTKQPFEIKIKELDPSLELHRKLSNNFVKVHSDSSKVGVKNGSLKVKTGQSLEGNTQQLNLSEKSLEDYNQPFHVGDQTVVVNSAGLEVNTVPLEGSVKYQTVEVTNGPFEVNNESLNKSFEMNNDSTERINWSMEVNNQSFERNDHLLESKNGPLEDNESLVPVRNHEQQNGSDKHTAVSENKSPSQKGKVDMPDNMRSGQKIKVSACSVTESVVYPSVSEVSVHTDIDENGDNEAKRTVNESNPSPMQFADSPNLPIDSVFGQISQIMKNINGESELVNSGIVPDTPAGGQLAAKENEVIVVCQNKSPSTEELHGPVTIELMEHAYAVHNQCSETCDHDEISYASSMDMGAGVPRVDVIAQQTNADMNDVIVNETPGSIREMVSGRLADIDQESEINIVLGEIAKVNHDTERDVVPKRLAEINREKLGLQTVVAPCGKVEATSGNIDPPIVDVEDVLLDNKDLSPLDGPWLLPEDETTPQETDVRDAMLDDEAEDMDLAPIEAPCLDDEEPSRDELDLPEAPCLEGEATPDGMDPEPIDGPCVMLETDTEVTHKETDSPTVDVRSNMLKATPEETYMSMYVYPPTSEVRGTPLAPTASDARSDGDASIPNSGPTAATLNRTEVCGGIKNINIHDIERENVRVEMGDFNSVKSEKDSTRPCHGGSKSKKAKKALSTMSASPIKNLDQDSVTEANSHSSSTTIIGPTVARSEELYEPTMVDVDDPHKMELSNNAKDMGDTFGDVCNRAIKAINALSASKISDCDAVGDAAMLSKPKAADEKSPGAVNSLLNDRHFDSFTPLNESKAPGGMLVNENALNESEESETTSNEAINKLNEHVVLEGTIVPEVYASVSRTSYVTSDKVADNIAQMADNKNPDCSSSETCEEQKCPNKPTTGEGRLDWDSPYGSHQSLPVSGSTGGDLSHTQPEHANKVLKLRSVQKNESDAPEESFDIMPCENTDLGSRVSSKPQQGSSVQPEEMGLPNAGLMYCNSDSNTGLAERQGDYWPECSSWSPDDLEGAAAAAEYNFKTDSLQSFAANNQPMIDVMEVTCQQTPNHETDRPSAPDDNSISLHTSRNPLDSVSSHLVSHGERQDPGKDNPASSMRHRTTMGGWGGARPKVPKQNVTAKDSSRKSRSSKKTKSPSKIPQDIFQDKIHPEDPSAGDEDVANMLGLDCSDARHHSSNNPLHPSQSAPQPQHPMSTAPHQLWNSHPHHSTTSAPHISPTAPEIIAPSAPLHPSPAESYGLTKAAEPDKQGTTETDNDLRPEVLSEKLKCIEIDNNADDEKTDEDGMTDKNFVGLRPTRSSPMPTAPGAKRKPGHGVKILTSNSHYQRPNTANTVNSAGSLGSEVKKTGIWQKFKRAMHPTSRRAASETGNRDRSQLDNKLNQHTGQENLPCKTRRKAATLPYQVSARTSTTSTTSHRSRSSVPRTRRLHLLKGSAETISGPIPAIQKQRTGSGSNLIRTIGMNNSTAGVPATNVDASRTSPKKNSTQKIASPRTESPGSESKDRLLKKTPNKSSVPEYTGIRSPDKKNQISPMKNNQISPIKNNQIGSGKSSIPVRTNLISPVRNNQKRDFSGDPKITPIRGSPVKKKPILDSRENPPNEGSTGANIDPKISGRKTPIKKSNLGKTPIWKRDREKQPAWVEPQQENDRETSTSKTDSKQSVTFSEALREPSTSSTVISGSRQSSKPWRRDSKKREEKPDPVEPMKKKSEESSLQLVMDKWWAHGNSTHDKTKISSDMGSDKGSEVDISFHLSRSRSRSPKQPLPVKPDPLRNVKYGTGIHRNNVYQELFEATESHPYRPPPSKKWMCRIM